MKKRPARRIGKKRLNAAIAAYRQWEAEILLTNPGVTAALECDVRALVKNIILSHPEFGSKVSHKEMPEISAEALNLLRL